MNFNINGGLLAGFSTAVTDSNAVDFDINGVFSAGLSTTVAADSSAVELNNFFLEGLSITVPDSNAVEFDIDGVFQLGFLPQYQKATQWSLTMMLFFVQLVFYHNTSNNAAKWEGTLSRGKWRLRLQCSA